jgi:transcriptional regulator
MLILRTLALEPMHGWGISDRIRQMSQDVFQVNQGSLYPALQRLKRKGFVKSTWQTTENNRRARYYALTPAGRRQLAAELRDWERSSAAVNRIIQIAY